MTCLLRLLFVMTCVCMIGCGQNKAVEVSTDSTDEPQLEVDCSAEHEASGELSDRDLEVIEFVLRERYGNGSYPKDRIDFLTFTPMPCDDRKWTWEDPPESFLERLKDLDIDFQKPSLAMLDDQMSVLVKETKQKGWMHWVHIRRWISETEVEVQSGVWSCQLGGGASIFVLKKAGKTWKRLRSGPAWIS